MKNTMLKSSTASRTHTSLTISPGVGRTPIRKLGYDERFIRPIRELKARGLDYTALLETVGKIYHFDEPADAESQKLQQMFKDEPLKEVVLETTGLKDDPDLVEEIIASIKAAD